MAQSYWIPPNQYGVAASARWTLGRKSSGIPMLEFAGVAAGDTNTIIQIPIPVVVDGAGRQSLPNTIDVFHFVSGGSANVFPISAGSTGINLYELDFTTISLIYAGGKAVGASAALAAQCNARTSAAFIAAQQVSAVAVTPAVLPATIVGINVSALPTSAIATTITLGLAPPFPNQESDKTHVYTPRLVKTGYTLEISASVAISAIWEHYGALCTWN